MNNVEMLSRVLAVLGSMTTTGFADAERLLLCRDGIQKVITDLSAKPKGVESDG